MTLRDRYEAVVRRSVAEEVDRVETLPLVLVKACVEVLPVDGAGLSLTHELRVPLSASSPLVTQAERLQTTLGEGPCLTASARREPLVADLTELRATWPLYCSELVRLTPFRSVASLPLPGPDGHGLGAVDLYFVDEQPVPLAALPEIRSDVTDQVAALLLGSSSWLAGDPAEVDPGHVARRRMDVWAAVGMVVVGADLDHRDALAVLRAHAFSHDLSLDELAAQVLGRTVPVAALLS